MAERDSDPNRQLDLLSAVGGGSEAAPRVEKLAVRWVELDAAGRLGRAAWPGSGEGLAEDMQHLREQHRVSVILAVAEDAGPLLDAAAELGMDVRHLPPGERGERLELQVGALVADLRAGRRAVVVSADASSAALPVAAAIVRMGKSLEDAMAAVDGALDAAGAAALRGVATITGGDAARLAPGELPVGSPDGDRGAAAASARTRDDAGARLGEGDARDVATAHRADDAHEPRDHEADASGARSHGDERSLDHEEDERGAAEHGVAVGDERGVEHDESGDDEHDDGLGDDELDLDHDGAFADDDDTLVRARGAPGDALDRGAAGPARLGGSGSLEPSRDEDGGLDLDRVARSPRAARLAGAVLGGAIGDAMGHPTEFIRSFEAIRSRYGPDGVAGYELWRELGGRRVAPYTDDTQMAECVLRSLLWGRERGADLDATMRDMAERFVEWAKNPQGGHRAPGNACLAGCRNLERGVPWSEAGGATAGGCGSVMRAYPFGLVFAHDLPRAEAWAVAHSKLTHRDPIALAASAAMAIGVARVMRDDPLEIVLSEMVAAACRYSPKTAAMMARAIDEAQEGVGPETTLERLEGWAAHEAIAAAVYLFARHPDDPRAAILEGANTPGDSDSLATLAGALAGARAGLAAIPSEWVRDVERSEALLALALRV